MRQVLDAIDESPEWLQYGGWEMYTEDGTFTAKSGDMAAWKSTMARLGNGAATVEQWDRLIEFIEPLQRAVLAVPPLALRADVGALQTALPYLSAMADPRIGLRAYLLSDHGAVCSPRQTSTIPSSSTGLTFWHLHSLACLLTALSPLQWSTCYTICTRRAR